jgi:hypothetical protein
MYVKYLTINQIEFKAKHATFLNNQTFPDHSYIVGVTLCIILLLTMDMDMS